MPLREGCAFTASLVAEGIFWMIGRLVAVCSLAVGNTVLFSVSNTYADVWDGSMNGLRWY